MTVYPLSAVRTLALHAQGLTSASNPESPTPDDLYQIAEQIVAVQIDTLQMVHRSHYLTLWSRVGRFDPADFDRLIYTEGERRLYEGWLHAACIIPLHEFRYHLPYMRHMRENPYHRARKLMEKPEGQAVFDEVLSQIRQNGGLCASDFQSDGRKRGSWWDWKPAKVALEHLFSAGDLMIADRVNFQRVYDLRQRVMPDGVDLTEATWDDMARHYIERGVRAFGICHAVQAADMIHRVKRTEAKPIVQRLIEEGVFVEVQAELADGEVHTLIVHRDNLLFLEQAAAGALKAERTTFLNPFDNLFWAQKRDAQFWNFRHTLEAYKPAPQRQWGYYCLTIQHRDRMVGRFDPKLDRKTNTLYLKALYLEPEIDPDDELVAAVAGAMRDFMAFHEATDLVIEHSDPKAFGDKLLGVL